MLRKNSLFLHFVLNVLLPDVVCSSFVGFAVYANELLSECHFRFPDGHARSTPQLPGHDGSSANSEPIAGQLSGRNGQSDSERDGAVSHNASISGQCCILWFILIFLSMSVSDFDEMTCAFGRCLCSKVLRAYRRQPISNRSCCRDRPIRSQRPPATCRCITACCRQHNTLASGNTHRDASSAFQCI